MAGSSYITPEGMQALQTELDWLWKEERPRVTKAVGEAAAMGDRSENAEYIYGKRRLREIDKRLEFLRKRIDTLTVVTEVPEQHGQVFFGAWVRLADEDDRETTYRIVGPDEFDPKQHKISIESPMARALLKKRVGDDVTVLRPKGEAIFTVLEVWYHPR